MTGERLEQCIDFVNRGGVCCDIGTDHGKLPCELIRRGISKKCIAADVRKGPLEAAKQNIKRFGYEDKIFAVLSDGLENISACPFADEISDIVIAGMGGETISEIIKKGEKFCKKSNLILQPMTKIIDLRAWLYANGYEINKEKIVEDDGFLYSVMKCSYSGKPRNLSEGEKLAGFCDNSEGISQRFANILINKARKKYNGILNKNPEEANKIKNAIEEAEEIIYDGKRNL